VNLEMNYYFVPNYSNKRFFEELNMSYCKYKNTSKPLPPDVYHCHRMSTTATGCLLLPPGVYHCHRVSTTATGCLALPPGVFHCHQVSTHLQSKNIIIIIIIITVIYYWGAKLKHSIRCVFLACLCNYKSKYTTKVINFSRQQHIFAIRYI